MYFNEPLHLSFLQYCSMALCENQSVYSINKNYEGHNNVSSVHLLFLLSLETIKHKHLICR